MFLPFLNLGVIIVDEEHDQSYKQDEGVIYNARDMAISRASFINIPINLVTAVPSIETFENIKKGKYSHSRLYKRYLDANLPNHEIINLNKNNSKKNSWISDKTIERAFKELDIDEDGLISFKDLFFLFNYSIVDDNLKMSLESFKSIIKDWINI